MANLVLFLLGTVITLYSGSGTFPESEIKKHIKDALGEDVKIEIKIQQDENKKQNLTLLLKNWEADFFTASETKIFISDFKIWGLKDVKKKTLPKIQFEMRLDDSAVTDALIYSNPGLMINSTDITSRGIEVHGMVDFGIGYPVPFTVFGDPDVDERTVLIFKPRQVSLFNFRLPHFLSAPFYGIVTQIFDLDEVDVDYYIAQVVERKVGIDFHPVIKKWKTGKGLLIITGYFDHK
ncbi:MAG: hypothetical protein AB1546_04765 [bacterium]